MLGNSIFSNAPLHKDMLDVRNMSLRFHGLAAVTILMLLGCNNGASIDTTPVAGVVTHNGSPVADADVIFHNSGNGPNASGRTNAEGKFTLSTSVTPSETQTGAIPGKYAVSVTKMKSSGQMSPEQMMQSMGGMKKPGEGEKLAAEDELPAKFANPKTSGLEATVETGKTNEVKLELKD